MPRYRPATRKRYEALLRQELLAQLGSKRLDAIDARTLRASIASFAKRGVQPRGAVNLVRSILRAAVEVGELDDLPILPKPPSPGRKLPDAPSRDEVEAMLDASKGWLHVSIALAAFAGLRQGEVRASEVRDVDLKKQLIHIRRAMSESELVTPKSGHDRVVPMAPRLVGIVAPALKDKLPAARVIVSKAGTTPSRQLVLMRLKKMQSRNGLGARSFHSLRHFFCSQLVQAGASVEAVRVLAGHSGLNTTQRYVHATGADLQGAIVLLSVN